MSEFNLPKFLKPFLWSYDFSIIDPEKHKNIIIKNILDFGDKRSTDWLTKNYTNEEIKEVIKKTTKSEWSKKSINLWSLIYKVSPKDTRF